MLVMPAMRIMLAMRRVTAMRAMTSRHVVAAVRAMAGVLPMLVARWSAVASDLRVLWISRLGWRTGAVTRLVSVVPVVSVWFAHRILPLVAPDRQQPVMPAAGM